VFFIWLSAKPSLLSARKKRSAKPPALGKEADSGSERKVFWCTLKQTVYMSQHFAEFFCPAQTDGSPDLIR
jgi:hypothetical protein